MKGNALAKLLQQLASIADHFEAHQRKDGLRVLSEFCAAHGTLDHGKLCDSLRDAPHAFGNGPRIDLLKNGIEFFVGCDRIRMTKREGAALTDLCKAVANHTSGGIQTVAVAAAEALKASAKPKAAPKLKVDPEPIVHRYTTRLEAALGDDEGFASLFKELKADQTVTAVVAKLIAKRFASHTSSKSKTDALKSIKRRHDSLMQSRAKSAATAGRTAA